MNRAERRSKLKKARGYAKSEKTQEFPLRREMGDQVLYDFGNLSKDDLEYPPSSGTQELGGLLVDGGAAISDDYPRPKGRTIAIAAKGGEEAFRALRYGKDPDGIANSGDEAIALARKLLPNDFTFSHLDFTTHSYLDSFNEKVTCGWSVLFHSSAGA